MIMEWDSKLDEMFKDLDDLLRPDRAVDIDLVYSCFKKCRDIMKELAGHNDTAA